MNEIQVKIAVREYFAGSLFSDFLVRVDDEHPNLCAIRFGSTRNGTADIVLCNEQEAFIAIVECKSSGIGITDAGKEQLKSYLNSKGTRFGILAASTNSDQWIFAENLGGNKFRQVEKSYFEEHVFDPPTTEWTQQNVLKWKSWTQRAAGILGLSLLFIIALIALLFKGSSPFDLIDRSSNKGNLYQVLRIIDGDTIEIEYEGDRTSVQLIGVNAPETVHPSKPPERFGREATAFIQSLLLDKFVYLDFDGDKKDKYDRLLAYVYRHSDDLFVNVEIIRQGYGQTDARFPFKYMNLFKYHESQARSGKKMMWSR